MTCGEHTGTFCVLDIQEAFLNISLSECLHQHIFSQFFSLSLPISDPSSFALPDFIRIQADAIDY